VETEVTLEHVESGSDVVRWWETHRNNAGRMVLQSTCSWEGCHTLTLHGQEWMQVRSERIAECRVTLQAWRGKFSFSDSSHI
jgi:hypothetical protein